MRSILFLILTLFGMSMINACTSYPIDSKYFSRNVTYTMLQDKVVLFERGRPATVTMDEWPQVIFLSADGKRTVSELTSELGRHYKDGIPPGLPEQTHSLVRALADRGFIMLHDRAIQLPYYLATPIEKQNMERTKKLMEEDGFIDKPSK